MAIIHCPECAKEVSNTAVACPNCGHPLAPPAIERETIVREAPPVIEKEGFPNWVFIPLAVLGIVVIFFLIILFQNKEPETTNINISTDRTADLPETTRKSTPTTEVVVPSNPNGGDIDLPPSTSTVPSSGGTTTTTIPSESETTTIGTVNLELKTRDKTGNVQPAKNEIFYLLDKDFESILREADVTPISGQSLSNSFGLSVIYPDRYNDFRKKALNAIEKHIKYDVKTGSDGKAKIGKVKPDSYYFFAIHKTGSGFALWTSPITINNGENNLNIQPQSSIEIKEQN